MRSLVRAPRKLTRSCLTAPPPARSSYVPTFLGAAALCFPGGFNKSGLLDDIKFKVWGWIVFVPASCG